MAVHDQYVTVRLNQNVPLPGRAVDESGTKAPTTYRQEFEKLPAPVKHLTAVEEKQFSLGEFRAIAEPVKMLGKSGQIRDYACVFYVKIWDHTSAAAKQRWQQARAAIERFFYPLLVRNDPW